MSDSQVSRAIAEVVLRGDQDGQPWALYAHDHGGLKGHAWTEMDACREVSLFIEAVLITVRRIPE